jgi:hypothetical protein
MYTVSSSFNISFLYGRSSSFGRFVEGLATPRCKRRLVTNVTQGFRLADSCERDNEPSGSIKDVEFLD